jgi:hypothetical protein
VCAIVLWNSLIPCYLLHEICHFRSVPCLRRLVTGFSPRRPWVRSKVNNGVCIGRRGSCASFLRILPIPLPIINPSTAPYSLIAPSADATSIIPILTSLNKYEWLEEKCIELISVASCTKNLLVGFVILAAVFMKSCWPCDPLVNRRFGGACRLHL